MIIDITSLTPEYLNKIPISILLGLKNNLLDIEKLPIEIAYEFRNINFQKNLDPYIDKDAIDLTPEFSVYTDFKVINKKNLAIIEYVKNFLKVDKGTYPFDIEFGTNIKHILQQLDINTARVAISEELKKLTEAITFAFSTPVIINVSSLDFEEYETYLNYKLSIEVKLSNLNPEFFIITKSIEKFYLM